MFAVASLQAGIRGSRPGLAAPLLWPVQLGFAGPPQALEPHSGGSYAQRRGISQDIVIFPTVLCREMDVRRPWRARPHDRAGEPDMGNKHGGTEMLDSPHFLHCTLHPRSYSPVPDADNRARQRSPNAGGPWQMASGSRQQIPGTNRPS